MTIWKPVPGFGGYYSASDAGLIRSNERVVKKRSRWGGVVLQTYRARILNPHISNGYKLVHIGFDGKKFGISVHRMVAMAFHGLPDKDQECCHNDGNSLNNTPSNLRWDTHIENNRDRKRHGTYLTGTAHPMAKFDLRFLADIRSGKIGLKEALVRGISKTHFYRIKRGQYSIDLMAEAERLANE